MAKISNYPNTRTTFQDDDLFDVSATDDLGSTFESQKTTWSDFKNNLPPSAVAGQILVYKNGDSGSATAFTDLQLAINSCNVAGDHTITLFDNLTATSTINADFRAVGGNVPNAESITINFNGFTLTNGEASGSAFNVRFEDTGSVNKKIKLVNGKIARTTATATAFFSNYTQIGAILMDGMIIYSELGQAVDIICSNQMDLNAGENTTMNDFGDSIFVSSGSVTTAFLGSSAGAVPAVGLAGNFQNFTAVNIGSGDALNVAGTVARNFFAQAVEGSACNVSLGSVCSEFVCVNQSASNYTIVIDNETETQGNICTDFTARQFGSANCCSLGSADSIERFRLQAQAGRALFALSSLSIVNGVMYSNSDSLATMKIKSIDFISKLEVVNLGTSFSAEIDTVFKITDCAFRTTSGSYALYCRKTTGGGASTQFIDCKFINNGGATVNLLTEIRGHHADFYKCYFFSSGSASSVVTTGNVSHSPPATYASRFTDCMFESATAGTQAIFYGTSDAFLASNKYKGFTNFTNGTETNLQVAFTTALGGMDTRGNVKID